MRKVILTLSAIAALGIALPVMSNPAAADPVVVIKKRHYDHDWRWRHRHHDAVILRDHRDRHHDHVGVSIRERY